MPHVGYIAVEILVDISYQTHLPFLNMLVMEDYHCHIKVITTHQIHRLIPFLQPVTRGRQSSFSTMPLLYSLGILPTKYFPQGSWRKISSKSVKCIIHFEIFLCTVLQVLVGFFCQSCCCPRPFHTVQLSVPGTVCRSV